MSPPTTDAGTHAIVLAAGAGRRFGGGKLCSLYRGKPLVTWAVDAAIATRVARVTIVLGADADRVGMALSRFQGERLRTVTCPEWNDGLSRSLICGLESLPPDARALLLFLGDMPNVSSGLADQLLGAVLSGAPAAMPVCDGLPAHPVAIASSLFPGLLGLAGDKGARPFLSDVSGAVQIQTDDCASLFDVDTREDLQAEPAPPSEQ
jgi:molybdenum cofactor cytidylyltransferase